MRSNGSIRIAFAALTAFMSLASSLDLTEAGSAARYTQQMAARPAAIDRAAPIERAMVAAPARDVTAAVDADAPDAGDYAPAPAGDLELNPPEAAGSVSAPGASARRCQAAPARPAWLHPV